MTVLEELPLLWPLAIRAPTEPQPVRRGGRRKPRCDDCKHPVWAEESLRPGPDGRRRGDKCRRKYARLHRRLHVPARVPVRPPGDIPGQIDLLQLLERISA
ncbi:hypothetical protein AB0C10_21500 [Microbispora amethystogenes]|uniref:hypothetical protein n=1 Tax=Microbispora amethystogenes TaxID=1427754 RepID=UPI0033D3AD55